MNINDYVYLRSEKQKILYQIKQIDKENAHISGVYYRVIKNAPLNTLEMATISDIEKEKQKALQKQQMITNTATRNKKYLLGKVLHIDGDEEYLTRCLELYEKMNVFAYGVALKEENIASSIASYIINLSPDIVVITGHDLYNDQGLKDLNNYTNTTHYIKAVREIRKIKSRYDCVVIAGACQSNFEALIASGADFASSPKRINIHTFDPVVIALRVATTPFNKVVTLKDIDRYIENGQNAFSGIETLGKMRLLL